MANLPASQLVKKADLLVENHLHDSSFKSGTLCQLLAVSRSKLHRDLKEITGQSSTKYILKKRLKRANVLLKMTDLNIGQVAYWVGFKDQGYFAREYRKEYGVSPSKDRPESSGNYWHTTTNPIEIIT